MYVQLLNMQTQVESQHLQEIYIHHKNGDYGDFRLYVGSLFVEYVGCDVKIERFLFTLWSSFVIMGPLSYTSTDFCNYRPP